MKDRAMQALYLLALEPVSETTADSNSYGFRKERSTRDAREQCFVSLQRKLLPNGLWRVTSKVVSTTSAMNGC